MDYVNMDMRLSLTRGQERGSPIKQLCREIQLVREDEQLVHLEIKPEHLRSGNRTRDSGVGAELNLGVVGSMENAFQTYVDPERLR
ncbi:hypothetical protein HPB47_027883 [Ixodes persulcatus]|uniref:Uncharacterized protein n=1 Tax=Ixodes persulcatus TaxID=34615 RepID=A0AC60PUR8_IXOPE|nr:hypothetical protein HPB47_027883 [Ixodes persulcatus]